MPAQSSPEVIFQPYAHQALQRGINQIVDLVRPTLGPRPRTVVVEHTSPSHAPELLESAGVISRRVVQLADRDADMGAMFVRHVLWRIHEDYADGTATAAVLFGAVFNRGLQYMAAGGNAMRLRRYLEQGRDAILAELEAATVPVSGRRHLADIAESLCVEPELAQLLGEMFDIVGEQGQIDVRKGNGRALERQYVDGMFWPSAVLSPHMLFDQARQRTDMTNTALVLSDLECDDPRDLVPMIECAVDNGIRSLVLVASKLSDNALALLNSANRDPAKFCVIAVRTPGAGLTENATGLEDLGVVTGGRVLRAAAGESLRGIKLADFGRARRFWADRKFLGVIGGKGDARTLRRHVARLRSAFNAAEDAQARAKVQTRLGRLLGGSATLLVGGSTDSELDVRQEQATRATGLVRAAIREGMLPGGGQALLACRERLRAMVAASSDTDEQFAYRILIRALEEPTRAIAANAGFEPSTVIAQIDQAGPGKLFDARSGEVIDAAGSGIYDVAAVLKAAVHRALSGAATALTVDTLIHKRNPEAVAGRP